MPRKEGRAGDLPGSFAGQEQCHYTPQAAAGDAGRASSLSGLFLLLFALRSSGVFLRFLSDLDGGVIYSWSEEVAGEPVLRIPWEPRGCGDTLGGGHVHGQGPAVPNSEARGEGAARVSEIQFAPRPGRQMVHLLNLFAAFNSSVFVDWFSFCLYNSVLRN